MLAVAVFIAPRLSLTLPHSRYTVTFADTLIFLCFLIYGGAAAIIIAALDMLALGYYLKWKGNGVFGKLMIPTNFSIAAIVTTITYFVWSAFPQLTNNGLISSNTKYLISSLGILALTQFFVDSLLSAVIPSQKYNVSYWKIWRKECFPTSMSQIVGAGLAGIIFKLINYADLLTTVIAFFALSIAYITYRQSIGEINEAIEQAEDAERGKRIEVEKYADKLSVSLEKEEKTNEALRESEQAFRYAALHDALTDLANRQQFSNTVKSLIEDYKNDPSACFHLLFLDIRRFKTINDNLGHTTGDKVLIFAAKRLRRMLGPNHTVCRLGGDEFAIILKNIDSVTAAEKIARNIHENISQPFSLRGNRIFISVNVGIAPCDVEYDTPEEILRDADIAMHYAKEGNTGVAIFTKELRARFLERARLEADLRFAIERNELSLHYQPIVSLQNGKIIGFEALLRWQHKELGAVPPGKFIPIAEDSGLMIPITVWVLREGSRQIAQWQKIAPAYEHLFVSLNVSSKHLSNDELIDNVEQALASSGISPASLKLEITESVAMENAEHTIALLTKLKRIGVQLSIDDFGTGYSSLSYLHRLPFDTLKVDRSFVYSVDENGENSAILQTIISLAKSLKMKIIAEGIETESQLALLQYLGCDYGQGFLLAKPQPKEMAEKDLRRKSNWLPFHISDDFHPENKFPDDENLPIF